MCRGRKANKEDCFHLVFKVNRRRAMLPTVFFYCMANVGGEVLPN